MEVMYFENNELLKNNSFTGVYGDKLDLVKNGVILDGIYYNDDWTVRRFLNGFKIKLNKQIEYLFNEFDININILKRKISELSKGQYKLILLVYSLLNNKTNIVLDYFDNCLSYKYKKKVINYFKSKYEGSLVVVSNDLVFLNELCNILIVFRDGKLIFNDKFDYIYKSNIKIEYPEIIKFIKLANKRKAKLSYTVDNKELLKDIYRGIK